jgi:hypothetical protein
MHKVYFVYILLGFLPLPNDHGSHDRPHRQSAIDNRGNLGPLRSEAHLNNVIHQLGVAGDIETVRGRGGVPRLDRYTIADLASSPAVVHLLEAE